MYNPCWECFNRYGHDYSEDCKCQYAEILNLLDSYGGIENIVEVMKGNVKKRNPYPKYSYNTGLITADNKPVYGIDNKWLIFEIKNGNGLPKI